MQAEVLGSVVSKGTAVAAQVFRVGPFDDPDRYEIGEPVEAGAEGILYRGQLVTPTSRLSLPVAVKALQPVYSARIDQWAARWRDQVELLRSLHIPGLVGVREGFVGPLPHLQGAETAGRNLYLVMNWVEGEALDHWVLRNRDIDVANALKLLLPVAVALDTMHAGQLTGSVPVVHRDIKPANILIGETGSVLVDFGLTKGISTGHPVGRAGTPGYIAPEVVAGGAYTPAADRYAFGATVFFLLTGRHPSTGIKPAQLRHLLEASPAGVAASGPELVARVVDMLDPDPERRPAALANWIAQLRQSSLDDEALPARLAPLAPDRWPGPESGGAATGAKGRVERPLVATNGAGPPSRQHRTHGHRRTPLHARPRVRITRNYALAVILGVAVIGLASDAGARDHPTQRVAVLPAGPPGATARAAFSENGQVAATGNGALQSPAVDIRGTNSLPEAGKAGGPLIPATTVSVPATRSCKSSFDPACGPFHWDPQPAPNQALTVGFTYSPAHPLPGDTVTFSVVLDDPDDATLLQVDGAYFGVEAGATGPATAGPGGAAGPGAGCQSPKGAWPPPSPGPHGHVSKQLTFVYAVPGTYHVHFTASSGSGYNPCLLPDPFASTGTSAEQTVTVAQPPPPPTTTTTTVAPPPSTTTTVSSLPAP